MRTRVTMYKKEDGKLVAYNVLFCSEDVIRLEYRYMQTSRVKEVTLVMRDGEKFIMNGTVDSVEEWIDDLKQRQKYLNNRSLLNFSEN